MGKNIKAFRQFEKDFFIEECHSPTKNIIINNLEFVAQKRIETAEEERFLVN